MSGNQDQHVSGDARPGQVKVRLAKEQDRLSIFKLCIEMHAETDFRHYQLNPQKTIDGIGMWLGHDPNRAMFVAEKNGEVIGMLATVKGSAWFGDEVTLRDDIFYVRQQHRGSRAAYMLMQQLMAQAKEIGAMHITNGNSSGVSEASERLYTHFGMRRTGANYCLHTNSEAR